ncbi:MAG TPA: Mur ligase family protein, partial [Candidatus Elarobacter sp.]|nr:Mur ligase family protein [Candidatus Elarobacter sp.]
MAALPGARVAGSLPPSVDAIATDSRAVKPGTLFIALRGTRTDGHAHLADALARGASVVVVEDPTVSPNPNATSRQPNETSPRPTVTSPRSNDTSPRPNVTLSLSKGEPSRHDVAIVTVADTRLAASALADAFFDHPSRDLTVIGVTGTNGKTTTTHLIRDVLESAGIPCGVIGTLGGAFREHRWPLSNTTPLALELHGLLAAQRDAGAKAVAMEVSSHALALERVDDVRFVAGVLTNITRDHLDFHGTMERYVAAKRRLFELTPAAAVNVDDPYGAIVYDELPSASRALGYAIDAAPR